MRPEGAACAVALNTKGEPLRGSAVAVMVTGPAVGPSVTWTGEIPAELVGIVPAETVPPDAAHATFTPGTPFPN